MEGKLNKLPDADLEHIHGGTDQNRYSCPDGPNGNNLCLANPQCTWFNTNYCIDGWAFLGLQYEPITGSGNVTLDSPYPL